MFGVGFITIVSNIYFNGIDYFYMISWVLIFTILLIVSRIFGGADVKGFLAIGLIQPSYLISVFIYSVFAIVITAPIFRKSIPFMTNITIGYIATFIIGDFVTTFIL